MFKDFKSPGCNGISLSQFELLDLENQNSYICKVVGSWILENDALLERMMNRRELNREMYFSRFTPSIDSLRNYLRNGPIDNPNQILFVIVDKDQKFYGHFGFKMVNPKELEVDNVMRIEGGAHGILTFALNQLILEVSKITGIRNFSLKVLSKNEKAIRLYSNLGFNLFQKLPLKVVSDSSGNETLIPCENTSSNTDQEMCILKKIIPSDLTP